MPATRGRLMKTTDADLCGLVEAGCENMTLWLLKVVPVGEVGAGDGTDVTRNKRYTPMFLNACFCFWSPLQQRLAFSTRRVMALPIFYSFAEGFLL